jgi:hypothetical protein
MRLRELARRDVNTTTVAAAVGARWQQRRRAVARKVLAVQLYYVVKNVAPECAAARPTTEAWRANPDKSARQERAQQRTPDTRPQHAPQQHCKSCS